MNNRTLRHFGSSLGAVCAAALLLASLKLPLWHLRMEAPQYQGQEALGVRIYPGSMRGDLREITVLNQYIGVRIPEHLPELRWLLVAIPSAAALGLLALLLPGAVRSRALVAVPVLLSLALAACAVTAQWQMHRIGHQRNAHPVLKGVPDFTPPLFGRLKVANFELTGALGSGALLIAAGIALQLGAAWAARPGCESAPRREPSGVAAGLKAHRECVT